MLISPLALEWIGFSSMPVLGFFQFALLSLPGLFCCCGVPLGLIFVAFWIWMLVDCLQYEKSGSEKIVWVLVVLFLHLLGAVIYFAVRYNKNRPPGAGSGLNP